MSQQTINTNLSGLISNEPKQQFYQKIFNRFPLNIQNIIIPNDDQKQVRKIVEQKMGWLISYLLSQHHSKKKMKGMLKTIAETSFQKNKKDEDTMKNICNLKVMMKYCSTNQIIPLMTKTVLGLLFNLQM